MILELEIAERLKKTKWFRSSYFFYATLRRSPGNFFDENLITRKDLKCSEIHSVFDADSEYNIILCNNYSLLGHNPIESRKKRENQHSKNCMPKLSSSGQCFLAFLIILFCSVWKCLSNSMYEKNGSFQFSPKLFVEIWRKMKKL